MAAKDKVVIVFVFLYINISLKFVLVIFVLIANVRFLYIISNFEIFSTVNLSMASKMAAKFFLQFFLNKYIHFCYKAFSTSLRMYHASEQFIIKDGPGRTGNIHATKTK